jgi:hypothetical protein
MRGTGFVTTATTNAPVRDDGRHFGAGIHTYSFYRTYTNTRIAFNAGIM